MSTEKNTARVFELIAGDPALDLVNTLDWRFRESGAEELLTDYEDVLAFTEQTGMLSASTVSHLRAANKRDRTAVLYSARELRERCAEVFYAMAERHRVRPSAISALEGYFQSARAMQRLLVSKESLIWELAGLERALELPLWALALRAEALFTSSMALKNLRVCGAEECRWLFLDTSKNHTRRWCDMKVCGNRMKARRFKAQHAGK